MSGNPCLHRRISILQILYKRKERTFRILRQSVLPTYPSFAKTLVNHAKHSLRMVVIITLQILMTTNTHIGEDRQTSDRSLVCLDPNTGSHGDNVCRKAFLPLWEAGARKYGVQEN